MALLSIFRRVAEAVEWGQVGNSRGQRRTQRALESSGLIRNGLVTGKALLSIKRSGEGKENKN